MTTPEGSVKERVRNLLDFIGAWHFMPAQWGLGRRGIPDFVGVLPGGRMFAIECKADAKRPTELQQRNLERIEQAGGLALIARTANYDEVRAALLAAIKEGKR